MKFLNGILGLLLISLAYSHAKPVQVITGQLPCPYFICVERDGFCRRINPCNLPQLNCKLSGNPELQWSKTALKECEYKDNKQHLCKSTCPLNKTCTNVENKVCVANNKGICTLEENPCKGKKVACKNKELGMYFVRLFRCTNAGILKVGQKGKCAPINPDDEE